MLTPNQWNELPNDIVRAKVIEEVRIVLKSAKIIIGTNALVELLYPIEEAVAPIHTVSRQRIYKALPILAVGELAAYATRGPVQKTKMGNDARPWLWHAPKELCEHCNGAGYVNSDLI